ncbi:MAG TPA: radical SAM protein, partial [Candidatus Polarisedimenticolia bacterium]|nr:radical SAM protein [Candidatus Polarisedimenticolia bacterium]
GQNVNAYHGVGPDGGICGLAGLIRRLALIPDLLRIRYTTSHPADMDEALIEVHGQEAKLMPHLHLPVQSGSDTILAAMNRRHGADDYRRIVDKLRQVRSDLALTSDFIVGFPGESEPDFQATLDLIGEIGFAAAYSFKYSPRPGTPAAAIVEQVPESVKSERLARLQALVAGQVRDFNQACIGRHMPVLFERRGRHTGQLVGKSPWLQGVHLSGPEALIGTIGEVSIEACHTNSLVGRLVDSAGRSPTYDRAASSASHKASMERASA